MIDYWWQLAKWHEENPDIEPSLDSEDVVDEVLEEELDDDNPNKKKDSRKRKVMS